MGKVNILDCTLRDGGYINDWTFGRDAIDFILKKLAEAKVEYIEVGFIKGNVFDENRTVYPDGNSIRDIIKPKAKDTKYVGMVDMSKPIPIEKIPERTEDDVDCIRVIFKQDRLDDGIDYLRKVKQRGYGAMAQLVSTDTYSDEELIEAIQRLNEIGPCAIYLVDSLGVIKINEFLRMIYLMDHNMAPDIILGYHSHNNLQQAMGNATSLVNLNLKRDVIIDASVFGMGRGAGNLNEELFAGYLNEYLDRDYSVEPMLEIIDEYLGDIYKNNFWGYALPFYLTASNKVHPNYGKYYNAKGTLTEKEFNNLLKTIKGEDTHVYSVDKAEQYYREFMSKKVDDANTMKELEEQLGGRSVVLVCPGGAVCDYVDDIRNTIANLSDCNVISVAFKPESIPVKYIFCSNMRRFKDIKDAKETKIITSNVSVRNKDDFMVIQYESLIGNERLTYDNAGVMALKMLHLLGVKSVYVAGMDGYKQISQLNANRDVSEYESNYLSSFNDQMSKEISAISKEMPVSFITPTSYK